MGRRRGANGEFWESALMNNATYRQYYDRLTELAISMFKWENVPDTIDIRFLELTLFTDGACVFFMEDGVGYLALQCAMNGGFNVYRIPTNRRAYAVNGFQKDLDEANSVIIYNNMLHTNSMREIESFSKRLYNLDRAIDVNANAQKTPILIQCDEKQKLTLKNVYMQYDGNMPVIWGNNDLNPKSLAVLQTGAPYVADKLYTLKMQIWNEALTYLGISNLNVQKKERLVADEVNRNMGGTIASRYSRLESRRTACDAINKMFGLNISVDYREDFREMDDEVMFSGETGDGKMSEVAYDIRTN